VTAALAGAVAHIRFLILDLDDPFDGHLDRDTWLAFDVHYRGG
jgi:hypothetical protein